VGIGKNEEEEESEPPPVPAVSICHTEPVANGDEDHPKEDDAEKAWD